MVSLRTITIALSLLLHGLLGYGVWTNAPALSGDSFETGSGDDAFTVERGISIEGIVKLGDDVQTAQLPEDVPVAAEQPPAVEDQKPAEDVPDTITSAAVTAPEDSVIKHEEPAPEHLTPAPAQEPTVAALTKDVSSGREQKAASASALKDYFGKLSKLFEAAKIAPKKRAIGKVEVGIRISADGRLISRSIKTSSGNKGLDDTALAIVDRAADQFPSVMPNGLLTSELSATLPFTFR